MGDKNLMVEEFNTDFYLFTIFFFLSLLALGTVSGHVADAEKEYD